MSPQLKDAMRKEAFVQGWMRARAEVLGCRLGDIDDAKLLSWLPGADAAYKAYRAEREARPA